MGAISWGTTRATVIVALDPRGSAAREIDALWWILFGLGVVALMVVVIALAVGLRRRSDDEPAQPGARRRGADARRDERATRSWILTGGIALPVVAIALVLVATVDSMRTLEEQGIGADVLTVDVIGHQWWWEIRYPGAGVVTANEIHIPAGTPVRLMLQSADVVHSFWVPELAGKLDLIPERVNALVIDADEPGRYLGRCAELCGLQHANMEVLVVAHDDAGYRRWLAEQAEPAAGPQGAAATGLSTFLARGCGSCHTIAGTPADGERGPNLTHVAGRAFIAGGLLEPVVPDLRTWITDPHAVKPGVLMPDPSLTDEEVDEILAYLETLR